MKTKKNKFIYPVTVAWSDDDDCFVARVPNIANCVACGDTAEQALKEVKVAANAMLETLAATGRPVPLPSVSLERLGELEDVLNLSALARAAKLPQTTLSTKLKRGTPLTAAEGKRLTAVLQTLGVAI